MTAKAVKGHAISFAVLGKEALGFSALKGGCENIPLSPVLSFLLVKPF